MMNKADRLWRLRDGALAWLYELRVDGRTITQAEPAAFMTATSWSDTEVTRGLRYAPHMPVPPGKIRA